MPAAFSCLRRSKKSISAAPEPSKIRGLKTRIDSSNNGSNSSEDNRLDPNAPRFGPIYGDDSIPNKRAKDLALKDILNKGSNERDACLYSIADIEKKVIDSYEHETLKPGSDFQERMVKDGCFFLLVALHILGGGKHLGFPDDHPYFGENRDLADWIPAMFFVGNQIPYTVIRALVQQDFFRSVIHTGTWGLPPQDPLKLALYRTVVEPELNRPALLMLPQPPSDIVQALHRLLLGSSSHNDPVYSEMKEFPDLEAGGASAMKFPSAGELKNSSIYLKKADNGITNISFSKFVIRACLYVPPLMIDRNTVHMIKCVTSYETLLNESDREVTSYLQLMRDLAATHNDFKILEESGIIEVKERDFRCEVMITLNNLVSLNRQNFTLNFRDIRRKIEDFKKPPWEVIAFVFGVFTILSALMAVVSYVKQKK